MLKHFKKLIATLIVTATASSLMIGCSSPPKSDATPSSATPASAAPADNTKPADSAKPADKPGETINLEFWHTQTTGDMPRVIQESVDRFMAANPKYKITVVPIANDAYKQKITIALSSGKVPDVFFSWSGGSMIEYAKAGQIKDLTELLNKSSLKDKLLPGGIAQGTYNGKVYGIPIENVAASVVWYNKKIYADLGLKVPTTIAELEANCDKIVAAGKVPFSLANKTQWPGSMYFMNLATRYGGLEAFQKAASGEGSFQNEAFTFAGKKIQEWVDKKYFNVGFNGADEDSGQSRQLLYNDQAVMQVMGSWFATTVKGENPDFYNNNVGLFKFPALEGSKADPNILIGTIGDNFYHISNTCKDPDGAFNLIASLLDDATIKDRVANGKIPPVKGIKLDDPITQEVQKVVDQASNVQLWYDQYLPPEVADVHKTTCQEIFGKTMTPDEANKKMQEAMTAALAKK